jgi:hypothetical protein
LKRGNEYECQWGNERDAPQHLAPSPALPHACAHGTTNEELRGASARRLLLFQSESRLDLSSKQIENLVTLSYQGSALNFQNSFFLEKKIFAKRFSPVHRSVSFVCNLLLSSEQIPHENEPQIVFYFESIFDPAGGLDFFELALCSAVTL